MYLFLLILLACPEGIEPPTHSLEGQKSAIFGPFQASTSHPNPLILNKIGISDR